MNEIEVIRRNFGNVSLMRSEVRDADGEMVSITRFSNEDFATMELNNNDGTCKLTVEGMKSMIKMLNDAINEFTE